MTSCADEVPSVADAQARALTRGKSDRWRPGRRTTYPASIRAKPVWRRPVASVAAGRDFPSEGTQVSACVQPFAESEPRHYGRPTPATMQASCPRRKRTAMAEGSDGVPTHLNFPCPCFETLHRERLVAETGHKTSRIRGHSIAHVPSAAHIPMFAGGSTPARAGATCWHQGFKRCCGR